MILGYLARLDSRTATAGRLAILVLVGWSVLASRHHPGVSGRGLVVTVLLAAVAVAWLARTIRPGSEHGASPDLYLLAAAGGGLLGADPDSAAAVFVFAAVITAAYRVELARALPVAAAGALTLAVSALVYDGAALGLLAYALGFVAAALASSNRRQSVVRAEQAELLLAQTQRSHEEQLRAARLQESARIARDLHDVLAHALAGLAIQLEATAAVIESGADREDVLARVRRAHELAREGLRETRRAVGTLRGDPVSASDGIGALAAAYRSATGESARPRIDGDGERLAGETGLTVLRAVQEALTNVRKHAPGAEVSVAVDAGDDVRLVVQDDGGRPQVVPAGAAGGDSRRADPRGGVGGDEAPASGAAGSLAATGGGYGLRGMRERARGSAAR